MLTNGGLGGLRRVSDVEGAPYHLGIVAVAKVLVTIAAEAVLDGLVLHPVGGGTPGLVAVSVVSAFRIFIARGLGVRGRTAAGRFSCGRMPRGATVIAESLASGGEDLAASPTLVLGW
jgi:hypothetical protein